MELRNAVEDIITSYEERIESISTIFDDAGIILGEFHQCVTATREDSDKINTDLRDILAKNESLRRKDFDCMMSSILAAQGEREKEVRAMLGTYLAEQKEMMGELREYLGGFRDSLAKGEAERLREFQSMIREILNDQERRKSEITEKLRAFQQEQSILAATLRELLSKGRELRIKDLKSMLREFGVEQRKRVVHRQERRQEVFRMLDTFRKERRDGVVGQTQGQEQAVQLKGGNHGNCR
jgi:hypothetical protein